MTTPNARFAADPARPVPRPHAVPRPPAASPRPALLTPPGPVADDWDWQLSAACRGQDVEWFFHPTGERGPARVARAKAAKAVCADCPVMLRCRDHALANAEPYGVWGGMTEEERLAEVKARRAS